VLLAAQGASNEGTATLLAEGQETVEQQPDATKGMKRGKGKKGGDVTGGKCYRYVSTLHDYLLASARLIYAMLEYFC
jgi:hypothetical protein